MDKLKSNLLKKVCTLALLTLSTLCCASFGVKFIAKADSKAYLYDELYRNQVQYSAKTGWNNDPNGLLYVNGTYHMYYQYSYNSQTGATPNYWADIGWGHATSTDLVHWVEQPVAIPAHQQVDGTNYALMFSGSAVYDVNNTSGLFDMNGDAIADGQGIVAILTQPDDSVGGQRQILAYSKDNGTSFQIYGEILGADDDGGLNDGEFRDPKVFWNEDLGLWLMAVGGGSVRMYSSSNLIDWTYIGETGYWGECPDVSRFVVDGETKYVLVISPEDKKMSHEYNGTTYDGVYYPAEYYVVGTINGLGMFVGETPLMRFSEGVDSYAFQSFNNVPDGKVYGISWSACWKTVSAYEGFRENYNGGLTIATELTLEKGNDGYLLKRTPVAGIKGLRASTIASFDGEVAAGQNVFENKSATVADIEVALDFSNGDANEVEMLLRASDVEKTKLTYNKSTGLISLDRSESSLQAKGTSLYTVVYSTYVFPNENDVLNIRVIIDRAFISVFAGDGSACFFSAIFPSTNAKGLSLTANGSMKITAAAYGLNSIFTPVGANGNLYVSTAKIDTVVGNIEAVTASCLADGFKNSDVTYEVVEGNEVISLDVRENATFITAIETGYAKIKAMYGGQEKLVDVFIYENGFDSELDFTVCRAGFSYINENGLFLSTGTEDAFRYANKSYKNFIYQVDITPANNTAQAAALMFGISTNYTGGYVITADYKDHIIKLWRPGFGDIDTTNYTFQAGEKITLSVMMQEKEVSVYLNHSKHPTFHTVIDEYNGGLVGLNCYNGEFYFDNVKMANLDYVDDNSYAIGTQTIIGVLNITDGYAILTENDYVYESGVITIKPEYMLKLIGGREYEFKVLTENGGIMFKLDPGFRSFSASVTEDIDKSKGFEISLGRSVAATLVTIGGSDVAFAQEDRIITISATELSNIADGNYTLTVYTSSGRAETQIVIFTPDRSAEILSSNLSLWATVGGVAVAGIAIAVVVLLKKLSKKILKKI